MKSVPRFDRCAEGAEAMPLAVQLAWTLAALLIGAPMAMAQASGQAKAEGGSDAVRPFRVHFRMGDLKHRTAATRWPEREIVTDQSQGAPLATIQKLARYWSTEYEWRKCEAKLNALPQGRDRQSD
jgi:hypothetical protein